MPQALGVKRRQRGKPRAQDFLLPFRNQRLAGHSPPTGIQGFGIFASLVQQPAALPRLHTLCEQARPGHALG